MNRILSWKIKSGVYAYIHIPNSTSHISKRIPENSPLWNEIISVISSWEKDEYKSNFQEMALEIRQRYGKNIEWDDKYWDFVDENSFGGVNIVMLAGQEGDGENSATGGDNDTDGDGVDDSIADAFAQFDAMIDAELAAMRAAVDEKNNAVKAQIEASVQNTVAEAKKEIAETQAELEATNKRLTEDLNSAKDAMEKATALFELGEGNITAEDIQDVINNVNDYSRWVTDLSGNVVDLKSDYDSTVSALTSMGVVEDVKHGLFSHFATTINTTASATGHVERWMASISGIVQDMAKWYTDDSVTEAIRYINASSGIIQDTINYVHGDDTNSLNRVMDAKNALILDEAKSYVQDVSGSITTSVYAKMDGLRGEIEESITKAKEDINGNQERIVSLGERMDATDESIEQWITSTNELSGTAMDLRDRWDTISGMVRSVSNMIVRTDENGNQLGYIEINGVNRDVVKLGQAWYLMDTNEPVDSKEVVPYYSYSIGSYISQTANEAIMSVVTDSGKTAAIRAAVSGDTALIGLVADKVVMDADVVMGALSAKTATIGGIQIGKGKITTINDYDQYGHEFGVPGAFILDGNTGGLSAMNAYIKGDITAERGQIGSFKIDNNMLEVKTNEDAPRTISFLNGDDNFTFGYTNQEDDGGVVFGAGIITSATFYCYRNEFRENIYLAFDYDYYPLPTIGSKIIGYEVNDKTDNEDLYSHKIIESDRQFLIYESSDSVKYISEKIGDAYYHFYRDEHYDKTVTGKMVNIYTKIYSNGKIETKKLFAEDGYFSGEINVNGNLHDGTIEKSTINNCNVNNTNIRLNHTNTLTANEENNDEYFKLTGEEISKDVGEKTYNSANLDFYRQNKNGNNNGQYYDVNHNFIYIKVYKGTKITIPKTITLTLRRYIGKPSQGNYAFTIYVSHYFLINNEVCNKVTKTASIAKRSADVTEYPSFTFENNVITCENDGIFVMNISCTPHLSTYGSRGKSTMSLYNTPFSIKTKGDKADKSTVVAPNGMRVLTNKNAEISVIDDLIKISSPNGKNRIEISDDGINIYRDGTKIL